MASRTRLTKWNYLFLLFLNSLVGEEAVNISMPLFRIAATLGDRNAKYTYGQLLFRGKNQNVKAFLN